MTTDNTTKLDPGSYMSGTMLERDLIGMFRTIALITGDTGLAHDVGRASEYLDLVEWYEKRDETENDPCGCAQCMRPYQEAMGMVEGYIDDFFDYVNENLVPEGFYFGAHEGDGADYGVWADEVDEPWAEVPVAFNVLIDPSKQNHHTVAAILRATLETMVVNYGGIEGYVKVTTKQPEVAE
jgi:hypothetical protein